MRPLFFEGGWNNILATQPKLLPLILVELIGSVAVAAATAALLVLALRKSRHFPRGIIYFFLAVPAFVVVDLAWASAVLDTTQAYKQAAFAEVFRSLVAAAIWIPYFQRSRRVRNTFLN